MDILYNYSWPPTTGLDIVKLASMIIVDSSPLIANSRQVGLKYPTSLTTSILPEIPYFTYYFNTAWNTLLHLLLQYYLKYPTSLTTSILPEIPTSLTTSILPEILYFTYYFNTAWNTLLHFCLKYCASLMPVEWVEEKASKQQTQQVPPEDLFPLLTLFHFCYFVYSLALFSCCF